MPHASKKGTATQIAAKTRKLSALINAAGLLACSFITFHEITRIERSRVEYTSDEIVKMAAPIAAALKKHDPNAVFWCSADHDGVAVVVLPATGHLLPSSRRLVDDSRAPRMKYFPDLCPGAYDFVVTADGTAVLTRSPFYGRLDLEQLRRTWEAAPRAVRQEQLAGIAAYIKDNAAFIRTRASKSAYHPEPPGDNT